MSSEVSAEQQRPDQNQDLPPGISPEHQTKVTADNQAKAKTQTKDRWEIRSIVMTAIATGVIALATIISVIISGLQWRALVRTDEATRAGLPRSWLFVETKDSGSDVTMSDDGTFSLSVRFSLKNYGTTPALIKSVDADLLIPAAGQQNARLPRAGFGRARGFFYDRAGIFENDLVGRVLRPTEEVIPSHPLMFKLPASAGHNEERIRVLRKWLRVVVQYADPGGQDRQTSSVYDLSMSGPGTLVVPDSKYTYWH